jgi:hypothetical protein
MFFLYPPVLYTTFLDQIVIWSGADFGTDMGNCHLLCGVVHDEESTMSTMKITMGAYPGKAQGIRLLLDAEVFDSGLGRSSTQGFTLSTFYWKDIPVMSQSGLNIQVGQAEQ